MTINSILATTSSLTSSTLVSSAENSISIITRSPPSPLPFSTQHQQISTPLVQAQNIVSTVQPTYSAGFTTFGTGTAIINECKECGKKFDNKDLYDIHCFGHANNMKCAICNMVLKTLKNYEKHCLRCKPFECQICGRVVRFRPNFIKHMRVHTGQMSNRHKYKCDVCDKEYVSFEYFKVHKKTHNDNVDLSCGICGKQFSAQLSLKAHSKLHSGFKLHKCEICGKGFGHRYNLKIHVWTHTGDFPFECKVCERKFHTQSLLLKHIRVHIRSQATSTKKSTLTSTTKSNTGSSSISATSSAYNLPTTAIKMEPQIIASSLGKKLSVGGDLTSLKQLGNMSLLDGTPTKAVMVNNNDSKTDANLLLQTSHLQKNSHKRKTPIIHPNNKYVSLSQSVFTSVIQHTGTSSSPLISSPPTSCFPSDSASKSGNFNDDDIIYQESCPSLDTSAIKTEPDFNISDDNFNEVVIKEEDVCEFY